MAHIPPWRWKLWGSWPPEEGPPSPIPHDQIKPLAELLSKQRPWLSAEENWQAAERALRQKPWRPWIIRFSGQEERSGWDWAELLLKVSIPVLLLVLSSAFSIISSNRQEKNIKAEKVHQETNALLVKQREDAVAKTQKETDVVTAYIKDMQFLILDRGLNFSTPHAEVRGVARGLTLAALSQVENPDRKGIIIRFLLDSGLNNIPGNLFSLREADLRVSDLSDVNLSGADLREAKLSDADLSNSKFIKTNFSNAILSDAELYSADLRGADLTGAVLIEAKLGRGKLQGANFFGADLSGAFLSMANLSGANLRDVELNGTDLEEVKWDDKTTWPSRDRFQGAKNIPEALREELGL